jgi:cytochrome bd-type quinol oxidase subunit 2
MYMKALNFIFGNTSVITLSIHISSAGRLTDTEYGGVTSFSLVLISLVFVLISRGRNKTRSYNTSKGRAFLLLSFFVYFHLLCFHSELPVLVHQLPKAKAIRTLPITHALLIGEWIELEQGLQPAACGLHAARGHIKVNYT